MAEANLCEWYDPSCGVNYIADEIGFLILDAYSSVLRSEERRVGKECRSRWSPYH